MPGTRTAPTVAIANINRSITSIHAVDASGDLYTDSIATPDLVSDGLVEAWVDAYQAATNASVYKVSQSIEYIGSLDPDNAVAAFRGSVAEGVNLLFRNGTTLDTETPRLIAPVAATMQGNQDIPLVTSTELDDLITAILAFLTGYALDSAQFTGRRERRNNPRIRV